MPDSRIPVSVVTGFLGAGKTTLLNRLLRHPAMRRTAVIINEFGEIGLDHELVERSNEDIVELEGGCLCCTIKGDLSRAIRTLNIRRIKGEVMEFECVLIETTGLAEPAPILQTLMTDPVVEHDFKLACVITVVDAVNGMGTLDAQVEAVKQAAVADRLLVTKADLATPDALALLEARLAALNPAAAISRAVMGEIDPATLFDTGLWDPRTKAPDVERWLAAETVAGHGHTHQHQHQHQHQHHHGHGHGHGHGHDGDGQDPHDRNRHDARIRAFCIRRSTPIASTAASLFLDLLTAQRGSDLLRVKGILQIAETPDRPLVIHAVQHIVHAPVELAAWPSADHDTRLVFITRDLAPSTIETLLDALTTVDAAGLMPSVD